MYLFVFMALMEICGWDFCCCIDWFVSCFCKNVIKKKGIKK